VANKAPKELQASGPALMMRRKWFSSLARCFEALAGAGRTDDAKYLFRKIRALDDSSETLNDLTAAARRAGADELADELAKEPAQ
jgi:hypothetical protein